MMNTEQPERVRLDGLLAALPEAKGSVPPGCTVTGIACDSRLVRPGFVFVAVPGWQGHGVAYVRDALERGAAAVVSDRDAQRPRTVPYVLVPDARAALGLLSAGFHGWPARRLQVIGVTGTNGKTTVAHMLRALRRENGQATGLIGTIEHEIGERRIPSDRTTPDAPHLQRLLGDMLAAGCSGAVIEVSSHALDQQRVAGIAFSLALFTNLSRDHLDYHGSMDRYAACKRMLFEGLGAGDIPAAAVVFRDDPRAPEMLDACRPRVRRLGYGSHPEADVRALEIEAQAGGSSCRVVTPWGDGRLRLGLPGSFNLMNALGALAAGGALGWPLDGMLRTLAAFGPVRGRLEPVPNRCGLRVLVDYAHTPDALDQVLRALREGLGGGRLWVVFGCGGERDRGKRAPMGSAAARGADHVILTSDNPRKEDPEDIIKDIQAGIPAGTPVDRIPDRAAALEAALRSAAPGDTVLIAGKGHETYQQWARNVRPFDDRNEARRILQERLHAGS